MSSDQSLAAASRRAVRPGAAGEPAVVVPLHTGRLLGPARRARAAEPRPASGAPSVAQIADYRSARAALPVVAPPRAPAPARRPRATVLPPAIRVNAAELETLLREHIDAQLELMREHVPQCRQSLDIVRRSVDLLLRLRTR
jgi:hypothetical protein